MQQAEQQAHAHPAMETEEEPEPLWMLWLACRRQWRLAAAAMVVSLLGWQVHLAIAPPLFQSSASIHVLAEEPDYWRKTADAGSAPGLDERLASQMELIRSGETLRRMIKDARLLTQADFVQELAEERPSALVEWMRAALGRTTQHDPVADALSIIETRLTVKRLGDSSVLSVGYLARSPETAAAMTERLVQAYFSARRSAQAETARRATAWLSGKVDELRRQALAEDATVEAFRRQNGLLAIEGRLIGDQRLTQMTEQLVLAQAELGQAEARSRKLDSIVASGDMNAAVAQSLQSPVIADLRQLYLEASRRRAELEAKFGSDHQQVRRLKGETEEYRRQMFEELSRVADAYRSEADMGRSRVEALKADIRQAGMEKSDLDVVQVTLRDLERRADNARRLYLDHFARLEDARQQESLPEISASIISPPTLPTQPSSPRKLLSLFAALSLGLGLGLAAAVLRDFSDRTMRRPDQLRRTSGAPVLGLIPMIERSAAFHPDFTGFPLSRPDAIRMTDPVDRLAFDNPRSRMTDVMRRALAHHPPAKEDQTARVIGVISCGAGEGKTTIAANLAGLNAVKGRLTLLVDADRVNPAASRRLAGHVLDAVTKQSPSPTSFLPIMRHPSAPLSLLAHPGPVINGKDRDRGADLDLDIEIDRAKSEFDLIVIDLPPFAAGHVAEEAARQADIILLVVEWGRITEAMLSEALRGAPSVAAKITGAMFNKVNYDRLTLYMDSAATSAGSTADSGYFSS
ncbi:succinoglycan biosynthesis transport protein ExoP [Rhizobium sp. SG_E_25_P2]|uniref:hypothetical protein n=1 Tax=Rhizobium sp. SG_E_25_P2 TaxID=2879942 RepID=UPI002475C08D|nr:hypothetical protein [Rhizobium sp. SG_E_25_P2]MDH6266898.1 succinoglycan biosynthesis transport protein ExoP [Rhizobium sp. SG_E_25_P2]